MQQGILQTLENLSASLGNAHSAAAQISVAIVVTIGLIMCVLSVVFPLRSIEPDFEADCAPWPLAREVPTIRGQMDGGDYAGHPAGVQLSHDGSGTNP